MQQKNYDDKKVIGGRKREKDKKVNEKEVTPAINLGSRLKPRYKNGGYTATSLIAPFERRYRPHIRWPNGCAFWSEGVRPTIVQAIVTNMCIKDAFFVAPSSEICNGFARAPNKTFADASRFQFVE